MPHRVELLSCHKVKVSEVGTLNIEVVEVELQSTSVSYVTTTKKEGLCTSVLLLLRSDSVASMH